MILAALVLGLFALIVGEFQDNTDTQLVGVALVFIGIGLAVWEELFSTRPGGDDR